MPVKNLTSWNPQSGMGFIQFPGLAFIVDQSGNFIVDQAKNFLVSTPSVVVGKSLTNWSQVVAS